MTILKVNIPVIETERLRLREPRESDLPAVISFMGSERSRFVGGPVAEHHAFRSYAASLGHWMLRGYGFWMVADLATDAPLGRVGFLYGTGWHEPELGWQMFEGAEGKGMAYEAAKAARAYGRAKLGLDGVISYLNPANTRSMALAKRLGCTHERDVTFFGEEGIGIWRHPKGGTS
ncbi:GNAT family N-acetyltransferase [Primorskyibacter sp. S187A]|uniref:GNAT family N-acetyltransferase n=1 Tax=Primorskyibacter sp. S187A TaxID=3415130 RepID=UPI003C7A786C